jgi:hypothetical protein
MVQNRVERLSILLDAIAARKPAESGGQALDIVATLSRAAFI